MKMVCSLFDISDPHQIPWSRQYRDRVVPIEAYLQPGGVPAKAPMIRKLYNEVVVGEEEGVQTDDPKGLRRRCEAPSQDGFYIDWQRVAVDEMTKCARSACRAVTRSI